VTRRRSRAGFVLTEHDIIQWLPNEFINVVRPRRARALFCRAASGSTRELQAHGLHLFQLTTGRAATSLARWRQPRDQPGLRHAGGHPHPSQRQAIPPRAIPPGVEPTPEFRSPRLNTPVEGQGPLDMFGFVTDGGAIASALTARPRPRARLAPDQERQYDEPGGAHGGRGRAHPLQEKALPFVKESNLGTLQMWNSAGRVLDATSGWGFTARTRPRATTRGCARGYDRCDAAHMPDSLSARASPGHDALPPSCARAFTHHQHAPVHPCEGLQEAPFKANWRYLDIVRRGFYSLERTNGFAHDHDLVGVRCSIQQHAVLLRHEHRRHDEAGSGLNAATGSSACGGVACRCASRAANRRPPRIASLSGISISNGLTPSAARAAEMGETQRCQWRVRGAPWESRKFQRPPKARAPSPEKAVSACLFLTMRNARIR
jgi:hypothetical protein